MNTLNCQLNFVDQTPTSARRRSRWILIVVLASVTLVLSCTYFLRSDYVNSAAQGQAETDGWKIYPKIRSSLVVHQVIQTTDTPPPPPDSFVVSFLAMRPVPKGNVNSPLTDVRLDSVRITFPPNDSSHMYVINEGAFISYRAISADSIIKRFSIVEPGTDRLIWHHFPWDVKALGLDIYVTTNSGTYAQRKDSSSGVEFDTILPLETQGHAKALSSILVRRDRLTSTIGFHQNM